MKHDHGDDRARHATACQTEHHAPIDRAGTAVLKRSNGFRNGPEREIGTDGSYRWDPEYQQERSHDRATAHPRQTNKDGGDEPDERVLQLHLKPSLALCSASTPFGLDP